MYRVYHPVNILTDKGIVDINKILPGDHVYEYKTGKLLEVIGVDKPSPVDPMCILQGIPYTDGRVEYFRSNDYVFDGENIKEVYSFLRSESINPIIKQYPIKFKNKVNSPLDPDPYIAGAFLIYGVLSDPYINLPYYMTGVNDTLSFKHSVEQTGGVGVDGRVHYCYIGDSDKTQITWKQLFGDKTLYSIINEYKFSSIKDRIQFIMGVFDMGYSPKFFKDNRVGIICNNIENLLIVRDILRSLGILSKVEKDEHIDPYYGNQFKLEIINRHIGYPGFTYMVEHLEYLLDQDNKVISYDPPFSVRIKKFSRHRYLDYPVAHGRLSNLILEKEKALFLSAQYLPRVSV